MIRVHRRRLAFFMPLCATAPTPSPTFCEHKFRPEFCPYCTNKGRRL